MKRNNDFKIREYHVFEVYKDEFGWDHWSKMVTFNSLSDAVKYAFTAKKMDPFGVYRVVGEFNYEEI